MNTRSISFLDVTFISVDGWIITELYRKTFWGNSILQADPRTSLEHCKGYSDKAVFEITTDMHRCSQF